MSLVSIVLTVMSQAVTYIALCMRYTEYVCIGNLAL